MQPWSRLQTPGMIHFVLRRQREELQTTQRQTLQPQGAGLPCELRCNKLRGPETLQAAPQYYGTRASYQSSAPKGAEQYSARTSNQTFKAAG